MCERHSNVAVIDLYRVAGNAELFVPISCSRGGRLDLTATTATAAALAAANSTVLNVLYGFKWKGALSLTRWTVSQPSIPL